MATLAENETYEDVKRLIAHTAHRFRKHYGPIVGAVDDLIADANMVYVDAYRGFDRAKGAPFSVWLTKAVWNHLLYNHRRAASRQRIAPTYSIDSNRFSEENNGVTQSIEIQDTHNDGFDAEDFSDGMSGDAKTALELTLNAPKILEDEAKEKGGKPRNFRSSLRSYLKGLGWTASRISESFEEIKNALK